MGRLSKRKTRRNRGGNLMCRALHPMDEIARGNVNKKQQQKKKELIYTDTILKVKELKNSLQIVRIVVKQLIGCFKKSIC